MPIQRWKKILVVKNRAFGDAVIGIATIQYLRDLFPESTIDYGVPSWVAPLFDNLSGPYSKVIPINTKRWFDFLKKIYSEKYDVIIELQQRGTTGNLLSMFSFFTRTPYYFHNHNLMKKTKIIDQGINKPIIQRDLDGVWSVLPKDSFTLPNYLDFPPKLTLKKTRNLDPEKSVVLGIVATRETKMWPLSFFANLAQKLVLEYGINKIVIPVTKSDLDLRLVATLKKCELPNECQFLFVPLSELPEHLSEASIYIGNDTGLKHLCASLGLFTVTMFGPESPNEWHPYNSNQHPYFFITPLECRTRSAHFCGLARCDSMICLNQIFPEQILKLLEDRNLIVKKTNR